MLKKIESSLYDDDTSGSEDSSFGNNDERKNNFKRGRYNIDPANSSSSSPVPNFHHFLANQTLFGLLKKHNLPLTLIDDYFFQEFLVAVRLAGEDYHPTASTVWHDNQITRGLSENDDNRF